MAPLLFGVLGMLGPGVLALEPETFGPTLWYSAAVVISCGVVGGYAGRAIAALSSRHSKWGVAALTWLLPAALFAAGLAALLVVGTALGGVSAWDGSFSEAVKGVYILFVYYAIFVYPWFLVVGALGAWYVYRRHRTLAV